MLNFCSRCHCRCDKIVGGLCPGCDPSAYGPRPELPTFAPVKIDAALADLADGERRWRTFAKRRTFQLELVLDLLAKGMTTAARQYIAHAIAELGPETGVSRG